MLLLLALCAITLFALQTLMVAGSEIMAVG
jgi:hypothetical protein